MKQAYKPEPQPLISRKSFIPAESLDATLDPAVSNLITTLFNMDETRLMEGLFWNRVPESLYEKYKEVNTQRANHIRDMFAFAWLRYLLLTLHH